jgi:hypothetical protein
MSAIGGIADIAAKLLTRDEVVLEQHYRNTTSVAGGQPTSH